MQGKHISEHLKSVPSLDLSPVFGVRKAKPWPPEARHPRDCRRSEPGEPTTLKAVNTSPYDSRMASSIIPPCNIKRPNKLLAQTNEAGTNMDVT